jgi:hypothetical protein
MQAIEQDTTEIISTSLRISNQSETTKRSKKGICVTNSPNWNWFSYRLGRGETKRICMRKSNCLLRPERNETLTTVILIPRTDGAIYAGYLT